MPRKRKEQPDNFNKAFPTAMRKLMEQKGTTQNELADYLKKTRQSVSYYCDSSSSPDWETIVKIADFFDVSTDYLLGRTEDPNRHPCATDELGLSPHAVAQLSQIRFYKNADEVLQGLNKLIENGGILALSGDLTQFCGRVSEFIDVVHLYKDTTAEGEDDGFYKFKLAANEEIIRMAVENIITEKFPKFQNEYQVIMGSRMIEYQKRFIVDSFDEIIRQVSNYQEFSDNVLQRKDIMK